MRSEKRRGRPPKKARRVPPAMGRRPKSDGTGMNNTCTLSTDHEMTLEALKTWEVGQCAGMYSDENEEVIRVLRRSKRNLPQV